MLEIQNVSVRYGRKNVLDDINLSLPKGVYGLLGPNGAGKTTLMRCIAGIITPMTGVVKCPNDLIGYLPQRFGMYKDLTVYETMQYFASLKGIDVKRQREEIMACLDKVRLSDKKKEKMRTLSGGMIRRVGIAQTLLGEPSVILVDEPTAGLDPEERLRFKNLISEIQSERTVIISTHIVEDVESLCDRIIILDHGRVLVKSSAEELRKKAQGKIFKVGVDVQKMLKPPFYIIREEFEEGQQWIRVLSEHEQPGTLVSPNLEDGYLLFVRRST